MTTSSSRGAVAAWAPSPPQRAARSQAAGEARPKGWRPISYVLIRTARIWTTAPIVSRRLLDSGHDRPAAPDGTLCTLLHRTLGALQLLLDDGDPLAVHERGPAFRRRARRADLRCVYGRRLFPAAVRRPDRGPSAGFQPGGCDWRHPDDVRPPRLGIRDAAVLLLRTRLARLRQRPVETERVDAGRQSVSRQAGVARPGVQHFLYGHQPRRVRVAADSVMDTHALRLESRVHVGRGRDASVVTHFHDFQPPCGGRPRPDRRWIG